MVLNATEIINYSKDIDYDYNAKFILMAVLTIYILLGYRYYSMKKIEYYYEHVIFRAIQALTFSWFFFIPMYTGIFFRTVAFDFIYQIVIVFYVMVFSMIPLAFLFGGGEFVLRAILKFFGKEEYMRFKIQK